MSDDSRSIDHLVRMANDIGHFFASEPKRADAIAGIANHLQRAWAPRMLRQIVEHVRCGGAGLEELPREAVALLKVPQVPGGAGPVAAP
jgi:formate dehydrogenase subunit delta